MNVKTGLVHKLGSTQPRKELDSWGEQPTSTVDFQTDDNI